MTGVAWFVNIFNTRRIKNVLPLRIGEVLIALLVAGLLALLLASWFLDWPQQTVAVDASTLIAQGQDLTSHFCRCSQPTVSASKVMKYLLGDSDYEFCNGGFRNLTGAPGATVCITSTYKVWALINDRQYSLASDTVMSPAKIEADLMNLLNNTAFDVWNVESDSTWQAERDVFDILETYYPQTIASDGGAAARAAIEEKYAVFLNVEYALPMLVNRMRELVVYNYSDYVSACAPVDCTRLRPMSPLNMIVSSVGNLGGQWALFSGILVLIITKLEDKYLSGSVARLRKMFSTSGVKELPPEDDLKILCSTRPDVPLMYMLAELQEILPAVFPAGKPPAKLSFKHPGTNLLAHLSSFAKKHFHLSTSNVHAAAPASAHVSAHASGAAHHHRADSAHRCSYCPPANGRHSEAAAHESVILQIGHPVVQQWINEDDVIIRFHDQPA